MNPFVTPDKIFISRTPQDIRAGIQRLASVISVDFGRDPMDGALYAFISRECEKVKLLRFDVNGWCMYYIRLCEGGFKWVHAKEDEYLLKVERRQLLWLLEGLDIDVANAAKPVAARTIL